MERVHLFEFEDLSVFPKIWRDLVSETLHFGVMARRYYEPVTPLLARVLECTGETKIVDLCSGASGPILQLRADLARSDRPVSITLTDLFPSRSIAQHIERASQGHVTYCDRAVCATRVPPDLGGMRTLFTGLHHFRPVQARQILANAVASRVPIGVFEFTERNLPRNLLRFVLTPPTIFLKTPTMRPLLFRRLFWTYALPVVPLVVAWDGFISNLRTYSPAELRRMVARLGPTSYQWEIGQVPSPHAGTQITYLLGWPGPD